jgi:hypothetical protein
MPGEAPMLQRRIWWLRWLLDDKHVQMAMAGSMGWDLASAGALTERLAERQRSPRCPRHATP